MKKLLTLVFTLFANILTAQNTFYKVFDLFDQSRQVDLIQTLDNSFILHGTYKSFQANKDGNAFAKLDNQGNYLFHKIYDSLGNIDYGGKAIACADSGFLFVGTSRSFNPVNNYDLWVVKTDKNGVWQWSKTIDGGTSTPDIGQCAIQAPDGSFIVTGVIDYNTGALSGDMYVVNLNANGGIVWKKKLGLGNNQEARYIVKDNTGFYIAGFNGVYATNAKKATISRMDYTGNLLWQKNYSITNYATISGISLANDGGCIATSDQTIFKVDTSGNLIWSYEYSSVNSYSISKTVQLADNSYIAVGNYIPGGSSSGVLYKLDASLGIEWIKSYGPNFISNGDLIVMPNSGGYVLGGIGTPNVGGLNPSCAVIKTDSNGIIPCNYITVMPQNMVITAQNGTITNNAVTSTSVGYLFTQNTLQEPAAILNSGSPCIAPVTVSNFSPASGCGGVTPVVITGTNFTGATVVTFGGMNAQSFLINSPTQITAVPAFGNTGPIAVTTPAGTGTSVGIFTVNPPPAVTASASPATICVGSSSVLTGSGAATYLWNPGALPGSPTVTPAATTTYTVTGTAAAGCSATATVTVVVDPIPIVTASASPASICAGGSSVLTGGGAATYLWNPGGLTGSPTVTPAATTTYTVTGTTAAGCTATATITVVVDPIPIVTASASPASICAGGSTVLTGGGAATFLWNPGGLTGSPTVTPAATTTYTVTGTTAAGCSATAIVTVVVDPIPIVTASASPASICAGSSSVLSGGGANTYSWNPSGLTGSPTVTPATTTTYTVTGTNAAGCTATSALTVTVVILNPVIINTAGILSVSGGPYTTYQWFLNGAPIGGATNPTLNVVQNGTYEVEVTLNGCTAKSAAISLNGVGVDDVNLNQFSISPNPAHDKITIKGVIPASIKILDMQGQVITEAKHTAEISLSNLSNGNYFIQLFDEKGRLLFKQKITRN